MKKSGLNSALRRIKNSWKIIPKKARTALIGLALLGGVHKTATWLDPAVYYHIHPPSQKEVVECTDLFASKALFSHKDISLSPEELDNRLGFELRGRYSNQAAGNMLNWTRLLRNQNPQFFSNLEEIVIIPSTYNTCYGGSASKSDVVLTEKADYTTFVHEIAHVATINAPKGFWNEWNNSVKNDYKYTVFPTLSNCISLRFGKHNIPEDKPFKGFIENYGYSNADEHAATFIAECIHPQGKFENVDPDERDIYQNELNILRKYNFLSQDQYKSASEKISLRHPKYLERALIKTAPILEPPRYIDFDDYGITLYNSPELTINRVMNNLYLNSGLHSIEIGKKEGKITTSKPLPEFFLKALEEKGYFKLLE